MPIAVLLLTAIMRVVDAVFFILFWAVVIRVLISWVSPDPFNPIVQVLSQIVDPILDTVRRFVPLQIGMIDLTPVLVLILLQVLQMLVVGGLRQLVVNLAS